MSFYLNTLKLTNCWVIILELFLTYFWKYLLFSFFDVMSYYHEISWVLCNIRDKIYKKLSINPSKYLTVTKLDFERLSCSGKQFGPNRNHKKGRINKRLYLNKPWSLHIFHKAQGPTDSQSLGNQLPRHSIRHHKLN